MTRKQCSIDGCGRDHFARGWCQRHYQRWTRTGDPQADRPIRNYGQRKCAVPNCNRRHDQNGYCMAHRRRWQRNGDPAPAQPIGWSRQPRRQWPATALFPYAGSGRRLAAMLGMSPRSEERWAKVMLTSDQADKAALELGLMAWEVWDGWLEAAA